MVCTLAFRDFVFLSVPFFHILQDDASNKNPSGSFECHGFLTSVHINEMRAMKKRGRGCCSSAGLAVAHHG